MTTTSAPAAAIDFARSTNVVSSMDDATLPVTVKPAASASALIIFSQVEWE
jgi:hypothetical protein